MSRDLTNLFIDETFQYLTQISGSELQDGIGNRITELDITASNSISASHSVTADSSSFSNVSISASYSTLAETANTASYILGINVNGPVADAVNAVSSSYALTASYALNAGAGDGFPYTGSAEITGSLGVTGSISTQGGLVDLISTGNVNIEADSTGTVDLRGNIIRAQSGQVSLNVNEFGLFAQKIGSGSVSTSFNAFNGNSQPTIFFNGVNSYFQATNNMYFENAPGGAGSGNMQFRTNGNLDFLTPNYNSGVDGGNINFSANSGSINLVTGADINIQGKAFAYTITSNINGFTNQVNERSVVRDNQRAFVETPLVIGNSGTIEVGTNSTLKVINEL